MVVAAPRQCNSDDKKKDIKAGNIPQDRHVKPAKLKAEQQGCPLDGQVLEVEGRCERRDIEARYCHSLFYYWNLITIDKHRGSIRTYTTTPPSA